MTGMLRTATERVRPRVQNIAVRREPGLTALDQSLRALVGSAGEILTLCIPHILQEANFQEPIPECEAMMTTLENQTRSLLLKSDLSPRDVDHLTRILKCIADLRAVAGGARQVIRLARCLPPDLTPNGDSLRRAMRSIGVAALALAEKIAAALEAGGQIDGLGVAAAYREIEAARKQAEAELVDLQYLSPTARRQTRAMIWSIAVAAENLARVAARFAVTTAWTAPAAGVMN